MNATEEHLLTIRTSFGKLIEENYLLVKDEFESFKRTNEVSHKELAGYCLFGYNNEGNIWIYYSDKLPVTITTVLMGLFRQLG